MKQDTMIPMELAMVLLSQETMYMLLMVRKGLKYLMHQVLIPWFCLVLLIHRRLQQKSRFETPGSLLQMVAWVVYALLMFQIQAAHLK